METRVSCDVEILVRDQMRTQELTTIPSLPGKARATILTASVGAPGAKNDLGLGQVAAPIAVIVHRISRHLKNS